MTNDVSRVLGNYRIQSSTGTDILVVDPTGINYVPSKNTTTSAVYITGNLDVYGSITATQLTIQYTTITQTVIQSPDIFTITNITQSVSTGSGALVVYGGAGIGGNANIGGSLTVNGTITGNLNGVATSSTNIAGGSLGQIPYQVSTGTTRFIATGTSGQVLTMGAGNTATWQTIGISQTSTNIGGGSLGQIPYQSANSTTNFISTGTPGSLLQMGANTATFVSTSSIYVGLATNLAGGSLGLIPYQLSSGITNYIGTGTTGQVLQMGAGNTATWANIANSIVGGTDTSVSSSVGTVTIWNTSTLQTITNRGSTTSNTLTFADFGTWGSTGIITTSAASFGNVNVTSATVPANGMYLSAANTPALSANGALIVSWTNAVFSFNRSVTVGNNQLTSSNSPGASSAAINLTGTPYSGGTATTTFPLAYFNTTGATAVTTFSTGGTYLGINAASGFAGNFLDFHVNGSGSTYKLGNDGTTTQSGTATIGAGNNFIWYGRTVLNAPVDGSMVIGNNALSNTFTLTAAGATATPKIQLGAADAASPVAQTLQVQSVVTGTSNTAGAKWSFYDSAGTGTGAPGGFAWYTHPAGSSGSATNAASLMMDYGISTAGFLTLNTAMLWQQSGSNKFEFNAGSFFSGAAGNGFLITPAAPSGTAPVYIVNRTATSAGIGASTAGNTTIIASNGAGGSGVNALDVAYNNITVSFFSAGIVHSSSSGTLTSSAVNLSGTDVTGNLPVTNLNSGTNASSSTFWCGNGSWSLPTSNQNIYAKTDFITTSNQTTFTSPYTVGFVDVWRNGVKLSASQYTATNGTTVVLNTGTNLNDVVELIAWSVSNIVPGIYNKVTYVTTSSQTTFAANYTPGYVDVWQNGSKLSTSEFTATDGATVVLGTGAIVNDIIEIISWTLFTLLSPALAGIPTAPTASTGTSTTQIANAQFVNTAITNAIASPGNAGMLHLSTTGTFTIPATAGTSSYYKFRLSGNGGNGGAGGNGSSNIAGGGGGGQGGVGIYYVRGLPAGSTCTYTQGVHGTNATLVVNGVTLTATPGADGAGAGTFGANGGGDGGSGGTVTISSGTVYNEGGSPGITGTDGLASVYAGAGGSGGGPGAGKGVGSGGAVAPTVPGSGGAGGNGAGSAASNGLVGECFLEYWL